MFKRLILFFFKNFYYYFFIFYLIIIIGFIGESNKIKNDPSYGFYDELCDQSWYIVFNIVNYEIDITDDQNIYRYGSIDEVLYYELF